MHNTIKVVLAGNPNTGKSTVFNALTGLSQKTGNFPGVTVEKKTGYFYKNNVKVEITDLPGIYSLYPRSLDEKIALETICSKDARPDIVVIIADATNLKRNLLLYTQIADLSIPTILVLNMIDEAERQGIKIDIGKLACSLNTKIIELNARNKIGIEELKSALVSPIPINRNPKQLYTYDANENLLNKIKIKCNVSNDYEALHLAHQANNLNFVDKPDQDYIKEVIRETGFNTAQAQRDETMSRYKYLDALLKDISDAPKLGNEVRHSKQNSIDKVLTHKIFGLVSLCVVLFITFQLIFTIAEYPKSLLENGFADLQSLLKDILPKGAFSSLLIDGLIPGLSGVITFVPQIVLLFGFITILEDSGYMARIVFIMDSIMRKVGLNGKSVVPLMGSMACAVPAILATRTIENRKNRIITILVTPLMSCSARLPVYTLLIAVAIPNKYLWNIISLQGLIMLFMYFLGFIAVMLSALIFKFFIKSDAKNYFVLELPNYRRPKLTSIMYSMYTKTKHFVISIGKVIIIVSIILWALSSYGPPSKFIEIEQKYKEKAQIQGYNLQELNQEKQSELLEHSYAGMLGKVIEPVIRPLGYDWKIGIALVASLAAREVFVGSMATIYSIGDADDIDAAIPTLEEKLKSKDPETGQYIFSPLVAISLMIFYAFAMQCASTLAVVYKETRSIKWPLIQFTYMTSLAYILSLIIYNLFL